MTTTSSNRPSAAALAQTMRQKIDSGEWPPGTQLPSEDEGASEHGVARGTYRDALRILRQAGLLETRPKVGTWVREQQGVRLLGPERYRPLLPEELTSVRIVDRGSERRVPALTQPSTPSRMPAGNLPAPLAGWFGGAAEMVVARRGVVLADGGGAQMSLVIMPERFAELVGLDTDAGQLQAGAIRGRLEAIGLLHVVTTERVTTRLPTQLEAEGLGMPREAPVLVLQWAMTFADTVQSRVIAAGESALPGDRVVLRNELR